jgi:site-specific DNA-methyltransferase (adenine-specific)
MNELYYGDNLEILRHKIKDDTIDLCYIGPPFNSKRNYFQIYNNIGKEDQAQAQAFIDTWTWNALADRALQEILTNECGRYTRQTIELLKGFHAVLGCSGLLAYLVSITQRVNEIQRVLKPTGSFYLHCDPSASHYLKLILDSVFCARSGNYRNEIIWKRSPFAGSSKAKAQQYPRSHDVVFFYTAGIYWIWNRPVLSYTENYLSRFKWDDNDGRGRYRKTLLKTYSEKTFERLKSENRLIPPVKQNASWSYKQYLLESSSEIQIDDLWTDINSINPVAKERLGYPTQKPEALLERIIQTSSNEGDVILDAYCGCGTTVAVAQRLNRNWIGIDITYQSIDVILKRLEEHFSKTVLDTIKLDGIPKDMASAVALANKKDDRLRKEFEKWAVLTYSRNQAVINDKKGADKGVDGVVYIATGKHSTERVIFQVKSGKVKRSDIAVLNSDRLREQAVMAILITLEEPSKPMREEALQTGYYHHPFFNRDNPCVQIISIREIIEDGKRIELPLPHDVLKTAAQADIDEQYHLSLDD